MENNNKKINVLKVVFIIMTLILVINNVLLLFNIKGLHNIENVLRLVGSIIIVLLTLLIVFLNIKFFGKRKKTYMWIMLVVNIILICIIGFLNFNFNLIYSKLNKVTTNYTTYSISLVAKKDANVSSIKDVGNNDIGVINDREIANGYNFASSIISSKKMKNKLVEYDNYFSIIDDLLDGKIKFAFLPSNYTEAFSSVEGYDRLNETIKTIYEESKKEEQQVSTKSINEPFTLLLMGVDAVGDGISNMTANGDSLILITFNPDTFNVTMMSIPRDSYVPISCMGNKRNKITHSSWGGEKCIINTIQNFTGITIDYYVKINFNGVVELVDTLGGIDMNVDYSFCEQNSRREFGANTVYVEAGQQTLNGEQALAYSRNRHPNPEYCDAKWTNYTSNDFIRGAHQQEVIKALLTKIKNVRDLSTIYSLLDTISNNMETNMDVNTILSFYNIAKDLSSKFKNNTSIDDIVNIEKLYLNGYGAMIYDYSQSNNSGSRLVLWDYVLYEGSVTDVSNAMKLNLGLGTTDVVKTFSYDANSGYKQTVIGQKSYNEAGITLLPNFVGRSKDEAQAYANLHNIKLTIEYVSESDYEPNIVVSQDPGEKMDLGEMTETKGLKIVVMEGTKKFDYTKCVELENKNNAKCLFIDYTGKTYDSFIEWLSPYTNIKKNISYSIIDEKSEDYDETKAGVIASITINGEPIDALTIYDIKDSKVVVKYYGKKTKEEEKPKPEDNKPTEDNKPNEDTPSSGVENSSQGNESTEGQENNNTTNNEEGGE